MKNPERPYINRIKSILSRKVEGNGSIYILAIMFMIFFLLLFKAALDKERLYVTYDAVDDAIVSSLISASPINIREYGRSGQLVIYDDITKDPVVGLGQPVLTEEEKAQELLTNPDLFSPVTDYYLNRSYNSFMNSLKVNLKLDGSMNATISGIDGVVNVTEFSVYNMFEYYDDTGSRLHYRFVRYTYNGSAWSVYPYNIDTPVSVYNSFDDTNTVLDSTTVTANLSFRIKVTENNSWIGGYASTRDITYQRLVDVTD